MNPIIKVLVIPGGSMPARGRSGDVGYDLSVRALIRKNMDKDIPYMHETIWDFACSPPPTLLSKAKARFENGQWKYFLGNGESVLLGLGVVLGRETPDWFAETKPRSHIALKKGQINHLDDVPIDPNFRGEIGAFITNHGLDPIEIHRGWSPCQLEFFCKCCSGRGFIRPILEQVFSFEDLGETNRQFAWNGSSDSGLYQCELDLPSLSSDFFRRK